jgi:hypothetical protein
MPQHKRQTTEHEKYIIQNNTCLEAMEILGISRATINNICRDNEIEFKRIRAIPKSGKYGNRTALKIDYKNNMTISQLAVKYNLLPSVVRSILQQKTHGLIFHHIPANVIDWLDSSCPKGMTIYEYAAIIIRDAYEEETQ